jgi:hypothetical protein
MLHEVKTGARAGPALRKKLVPVFSNLIPKCMANSNPTGLNDHKASREFLPPLLHQPDNLFSNLKTS